MTGRAMPGEVDSEDTRVYGQMLSGALHCVRFPPTP